MQEDVERKREHMFNAFITETDGDKKLNLFELYTQLKASNHYHPIESKVVIQSKRKMAKLYNCQWMYPKDIYELL